MKLLMVSGNGPGAICGIADYTRGLLRGLAAAEPEWEFVWMCRRTRWWKSPLRRDGGIRVLSPVHSWRGVNVSIAANIARLVRPTVVHIQDEGISFFEGPAAAKIAERSACPVAATLHEYHDGRPWTAYTDRLARRADRVIASDRRTADRVLAATGRRADAVWWSPANVVPGESTRELQPHLCVTFGLLSAIKNLRAVRDALALCRRRFPDLRWRIVGPFEPKKHPHHAELAATLRDDWIEFTGGRAAVDDPELRRWLGEAAVFVLPFADGASPRRTSLQTAWAFGRPVVTTPPDVPEPDLRDGENVLFAGLSDPAALAARIAAVFADRALAARLAAGSAAAADRFRSSELVRRHREMYRELLGQKSHTTRRDIHE